MSDQLEHNEFDKRVNERLDGHEITPPEGLWSNISARAEELDATNKYKKRFGFMLWFSLVVVVLMSGTILFYERNAQDGELRAEKMVGSMEVKGTVESLEQRGSEGSENTTTTEVSIDDRGSENEIKEKAEEKEVDGDQEKLIANKNEEQEVMSLALEIDKQNASSEESAQVKLVTQIDDKEKEERTSVKTEGGPDKVQEEEIASDNGGQDESSSLKLDEEGVQAELVTQIGDDETDRTPEKRILTEAQGQPLVKEEIIETGLTDKASSESEVVENVDSNKDKRSTTPTKSEQLKNAKEVSEEKFSEKDSSDVNSDALATQTSAVSKPNEPKKSSRITLALYFSPEYSYRFIRNNSTVMTDDLNRAEKGGYTYRFGVTAGFDINSHWSVRAGVSYGTYKQAYSNGDTPVNVVTVDTLSGEFDFETSLGTITLSSEELKEVEEEEEEEESTFFLVETNQKLSFIRIPISTEYTIGTGKTKFTISAGISTDFIVAQKQDNRVVGAETYEDLKISELDKFRSVNLSGMLGIGTEFDLSKGFSLTVQPSFKVSLMSLGKNTPVLSHPYSMGLSTGLKYRF